MIRRRSATRSVPLSPSRAHVRTTIANAVLQPDDLRDLRLVHKALADVNRLRIIRVLAVAESTVADLVAEVGLSQPLVSWHVGRLRTAGLVATRRLGRETFCRIRPEAFAAFAERQARVLGLNGTPTPTPSSVAGAAPASPADERVAS